MVYPESAPQDWQKMLADTHLQVLISPLHDSDTNPDGSIKKPHWHVMVIYDTVKNFEQDVQPLFKAIGGVGREAINSPRGYARYLCHTDNPEKHQYATSDVIALGGISYDDVVRTDADDAQMINAVCARCRDNGVYSLAELMDYAVISQPDWYQLIVTRKAYVIGLYLKSLIWESDHGYVRRADRKQAEQTQTQELPDVTVKIDVDGKIINVKTGEILGYTCDNR